MSRFISITSLQSTSHLGTQINPSYIAQHLPHPATRFESHLPHRVHYYMSEPKIRFTLFRRGGTLVAMGGKSVEECNAAVEKMVDTLKSIGMERVEHHPPTIHNICSSGHLGFRIDLPRFAIHPQHTEQIIYETEQYPGLRYRGLSPTNPAVTATVFHSGKCIVTGAKQEHEILEAFDKLLTIAETFKVPGSETYTQDPHVYTNIKDVDPFRVFVETGSLYLPMEQCPHGSE